MTHDGNVNVLLDLPRGEREIVAFRNQPLIIYCPIVVAHNVRVLDTWWTKNGKKVNYQPLYKDEPASAVNNASLLEFENNRQIKHMNDQHDHEQLQIHNNSDQLSTLSLLMIPSRIAMTSEGNLYFEKINHKISGSGLRRSNFSDEGHYRCVKKIPQGVVLSAVISVSVISGKTYKVISNLLN